MDRQAAIDRLKRHALDLKGQGVAHLSMFGSVARNEASPESDVDLLVDLDASQRFTLVRLAQLKHYVSDILDAKADITIRDDVKPLLRDSILEDEIRVF